MGGGSYSYCDASVRSSSYKASALEDVHYLDDEVFTARELDCAMDIHSTTTKLDDGMKITATIRESRDSDEHPQSFPIIIGLDVTGSMRGIPKKLITEGFPEMMKKIMDEGVEHAQVCFMGIGDEECDSAPIQVGQFETSDELCEHWLKSIYLEGGGGPNAGESYSLAWYVAARNTETDAFEKRGVKGVLITIGDEPNLKVMYKRHLDKCIGGAQSDIESSAILEEAKEKWNVYHINVKDTSGVRPSVIESWKKLLGDNAVVTQSKDGSDVPDLIAGIVVECYNKEKEKMKSVITESTSTETPAAAAGPKSKSADELLDEIKGALSK